MSWPFVSSVMRQNAIDASASAMNMNGMLQRQSQRCNSRVCGRRTHLDKRLRQKCQALAQEQIQRTYSHLALAHSVKDEHRDDSEEGIRAGHNKACRRWLIEADEAKYRGRVCSTPSARWRRGRKGMAHST